MQDATVTGAAAVVTAAKPVDEYVPVAEVDSAIPAAEELAALPPSAVARVRAGLRRVYRLGEYQSLEVEVTVEVPCFPEDVPEASVEAGELAVAAAGQLVATAKQHPLLLSLTPAS